MRFHKVQASTSKTTLISNPNRMTFFSDHKLSKNIKQIRSENIILENLERKHKIVKSKANSSLNCSLSASIIPLIDNNFSHDLSVYPENSKAKKSSFSESKYLASTDKTKSTISILRKHSPLKNALKQVTYNITPNNLDNASTLRTNLSNIQMNKEKSNKRNDEFEAKTLKKLIFNRQITSVFNIGKIHEIVSNDPNVFSTVKSPILTEKLIFKSLEAFASQSAENRKIIEVKDKIYFLKGLTDFLLPKAEHAFKMVKKTQTTKLRKPSAKYNTILKNNSKYQHDIADQLRLFDDVHSNRKY